MGETFFDYFSCPVGGILDPPKGHKVGATVVLGDHDVEAMPMGYGSPRGFGEPMVG